MNRRNMLRATGSVLALFGAGLAPQVQAQDRSANFLAKAAASKPSLTETVQAPKGLITPVADAGHPLYWQIEAAGTVADLESRVLKKGDSLIIDFGGHRTGFLSFDLIGVGPNVDAPARMRFVFGELISDVAEPFHPYTGWLSQSWLPEEIVTIDYLPQPVRLPRRYAFRFVKVEIIDTSSSFGVTFKNVKAHAVTSATGELPSLPAGMPDDLKQMDVVAAATLRDCMQTVFEDGPRRDQRLWTGDLRLQALTSYVSYRNDDLVKRCLYLLAAFPREDGLLPGDVYELPKPARAGDFPYDYAVFFAVTLADYVKATGDVATGGDLWPTALRQLEILYGLVKDDVFVIPEKVWVFIDWHDTLDRAAAMQAIYIYGLKRVVELARALGLTAEVAAYGARIAAMEKATLAKFYDRKAGVFVSGPNRQVSLASQAWMTIAGVGGKSLQTKALRAALKGADTIRPRTPYLNHYVVEALFLAGCDAEAVAMMRAYWGGMLKAGADTFWEAYSPDNPRIAPYNDFHVNSFCHAWSCTPSYLLRQYGQQIV
ncbi:hypothetical protein ABAC460_20135 [Asticcacaulis sp. AC460]|uniref:alpha-L-rhamnosidase-related protein n=1 Tax=Asticcacaulis sp. AC460 TaxID=1282360 RepID=UPI0003C3BD06|nr:family 78 glycoside hydrolase catalytic domain [Asticcacaulis sp. AC460]ESQ87335.1 hypothetical protein ABAC460_20135 [Asticcacaulis sp. AC460]